MTIIVINAVIISVTILYIIIITVIVKSYLVAEFFMYCKMCIYSTFQDDIILNTVCLPELTHFPSTYCLCHQVNVNNRDELDIYCEKLIEALQKQKCSKVL